MEKIYLNITDKLNKTNNILSYKNDFEFSNLDKLEKKVENFEYNLNLLNIDNKKNKDEQLTNFINNDIIIDDNNKKLNYLLKKVDTIIDQNINLKKIIYILFKKQSENIDNITDLINEKNLINDFDSLHDYMSDKDVEI
jgi:hypothetical protein